MAFHKNPKAYGLVFYTLRWFFTAKSGLTFRGPCIVIYSYNKSQRDANFLPLI